jgi:hypothetical protein
VLLLLLTAAVTDSELLTTESVTAAAAALSISHPSSFVLAQNPSGCPAVLASSSFPATPHADRPSELFSYL